MLRLTDFISITDIVVDRGQRQRKDIDVSDIISSVRRHGILQPIIIGPGNKLIAGERRLTCAQIIGLDAVPFRFFSDLTPLEQLIELEENIKRKQLPWQDEAAAILRIHQILSTTSPDWSSSQTADEVGISQRHTDRMLSLGEAVARGDVAVIACETIPHAETLLSRRASRAADEATNAILGLEDEIAPVDLEQNETVPMPAGSMTTGFIEATAKPVRPSLAPTEPFSIRNADALEFFENYSGPRFNFLHCDFPYGVELNEQAGQASFEGGGYEGGQEVYWPLIESMVKNWNKFMLPSAHLMFWFSYSDDLYVKTLSALRGIPGIRVFPTPLVWHKTDNKGIISDPKRYGRNIYEPAFMASIGDRSIAKPKANCYGSPTDKSNSIHTNEKPEPMLSHFFEMLVDEHTRMLDPTCGSGSSVRTAEKLGAECALGLEYNLDFATRAQEKLLMNRNLKRLSEKANG
jgi:ParB/RepB/Spo0J family partition protein